MMLLGLGTYDRVVDMPSFQDSNTTLGEELKEMVSDWELQRKPFCPLALDSHEEVHQFRGFLHCRIINLIVLGGDTNQDADGGTIEDILLCFPAWIQ